MTTDPQTDRPRALHLLEAANFLRDAHFRDGLSVQEIGTALRHMADEADPMVGSLARDGFGLDEIAAMPAVPVAVPPADRAGLRKLIAGALSEARRPGLGGMTEADAVAYMVDAVMKVLPAPVDRGAVLREAADGFDRHAERILEGATDMAAFVAKARQHEAATWREAGETLRRMAGTPQPETQAAHVCGNCEGIDPDSCLTNLDRSAARQAATKTPDEAPGRWCKCRSCWGWFVEDHPGEDLDELGRDLGWWSGLPEHRDAPAVVAEPGKEA